MVNVLWHYPISIIIVITTTSSRSSSSTKYQLAVDQLVLYLGPPAQNILRDARLTIWFRCLYLGLPNNYFWSWPYACQSLWELLSDGGGYIGSFLSKNMIKRKKLYPCGGLSNSTKHLVFAWFVTCLWQCQNHCSEVWGPELIVFVLFDPDYLKQSDKTLGNGNMTFIILQNEGFFVLVYFWQNRARI